MTKTLSLLLVAAMSIALEAQTPASPQAPDPAMTPGSTQTGSHPPAATDAATPQASQKTAQLQAASVQAELTKEIDSKKARIGDEVHAKTVSEAKLPDGTQLPKGTKLVGNVVEVRAKSKHQDSSHLVLALNRAVLKDGQEMPIRSAVTSMTAPAASANFDMARAGGAMGGAPAGGSANAGGSATGAASPSTTAPAMSGGAMSSGMSNPQQSATGEMLKSSQDRVAVGNKPKVMLSAPTTPESASVLDAQGEDISLESGTKFTVNVASTKGLGEGV
ncbi:hypothetical protein [Edaphobacter modestus]|uniref:Uncharacterized protein n=1 Tax=Edaphobacter modestus TaxID=388466 RepID=A0A4Q7Z043_9BACT|nr:hypothetical protein [Edaphobacter modestus]RZU42863.1 hypothetical protein BDD14_4461 [Edaphobacter modestus]